MFRDRYARGEVEMSFIISFVSILYYFLSSLLHRSIHNTVLFIVATIAVLQLLSVQRLRGFLLKIAYNFKLSCTLVIFMSAASLYLKHPLLRIILVSLFAFSAIATSAALAFDADFVE